MALFAALLSVISTAYGVNIFDDGIFETEDSAMNFFQGQDTNFDSLVVGDDRALAFGQIDPIAFATNNLEIKKNQDSGGCDCCPVTEENSESCHDCCIKVNYEQIRIGDRTATAFGFASATNNVKIVTNQQ
ncbi:MAG: hypothetical protein JW999_01470 [Methanotrichaceae archaeon]|nr:hypothetical protein [Methanotrichaceae archaeon]